jgi:ketosteroid isomerase-like protein
MAQDNRSDLAQLEQIERGLRALEDAEAIRNLKARYAALCDKRYDADGIAMLFSEDALWESPGLGRFEGREALRGFFREASGIFSFAIHYRLNGHIEVEGDTAQAQ